MSVALMIDSARLGVWILEFHHGFERGLGLRKGIDSVAAWRRVSRRIVAACSRLESDI